MCDVRAREGWRDNKWGVAPSFQRPHIFELSPWRVELSGTPPDTGLHVICASLFTHHTVTQFPDLPGDAPENHDPQVCDMI